MANCLSIQTLTNVYFFWGGRGNDGNKIVGNLNKECPEISGKMVFRLVFRISSE